MRVIKRLAALLGVFAGLVLIYAVAWRPWILSWGANDADRDRPLPGDEVLGATEIGNTRAITIDAPVEKVWPWLAQLGQDRGGFYSYEVLEDLAGTDMTNADRILPDEQEWKPGDKLWMYPPGKLVNVGGVPLRAHVPERALVFATRQLQTPQDQPHDGTWAFVLEPIGSERTRFLVRSRAKVAGTGFWAGFETFVFQPMHFVMERKMMKELAARAEGKPYSTYARDTAEVITWAATFVLFLVAAVAVVRRKRWRRALVCFAAAGLAFQVLTLVQLGPIFGVLVVLALGLGLWGRRPPARWFRVPRLAAPYAALD